LSSYEAHGHHWRILLLDTAARADDSLPDRLLSIGSAVIDVQPVDLDRFPAALDATQADVVLIAARSVAALARELPNWESMALAVDRPLVLVLDEPPDEASVRDGQWPLGCAWLRRDFGGGEALWRRSGRRRSGLHSPPIRTAWCCWGRIGRFRWPILPPGGC